MNSYRVESLRKTKGAKKAKIGNSPDYLTPRKKSVEGEIRLPLADRAQTDCPIKGYGYIQKILLLRTYSKPRDDKVFNVSRMIPLRSTIKQR